MEVIVYRCRTDGFLFVPSCFLPSNEAEHRYGPLSPLGTLTFEENRFCEWQQVIGNIECHSYALVSAAEAKRLLGRNHPYLRQSRPSIRRLRLDQAPGQATS